MTLFLMVFGIIVLQLSYYLLANIYTNLHLA